MSNDASEIVVGANGRVLVANADNVSSFPDDISTALDGAFKEVGFVSTDGVTFTDSKNINDIPAWQAFYPVRKVVTDKMSKVEFVMKQWDTNTVTVAFGGGEVDMSHGAAVYTPPEPGDIQRVAVVVEFEDGADTYRLVIPVGQVTGEVSTKVTRTDAADLPVAIEATPQGLPVEGDLGSQPWYMVTNASQFGS